MSLSDPLRPPGKTPRRAEPVQPDRPGRGADRLEDDEAGSTSKENLDKQLEQTKTALANVRNP